MIRKKILLLGDFNVGKTSLIRQYVEQKFSNNFLTTVGVKITKKLFEYQDKKNELILWDLEGATPQKSIDQSYLGGAQGAIFVADVTRKNTIDALEQHIKSFKQINPDAPYVIAYNKTDLFNKEQIEMLEKGENIFHTSVKDAINIDILFEQLGEELFHN